MAFKADPLAVHAVVHGDVRVSAGPLSSSSSGPTCSSNAALSRHL